MDRKVPVIEVILENDYKGLIYINEHKEIDVCSDYAKKITGLISEEERLHPSGQLQNGDIVIIADNEIGSDDELDIKTLETINIEDKNIEKGDALVAIGIYKNKRIKTKYKYVKNYNPNGKLELKENYLGFDIIASIDFAQNTAEIAINGESYKMSYFNSVGHMVVADSETGQVKFFQSRGYGYRKEEIGRLLEGKIYSEKSRYNYPQSMDIRKKYTDFFYDSEILKTIENVFEKDNEYAEKGIYEIYKIPMFCQFIRAKFGSEYDGVYLIFQDVSLLENVRKERNAIIKLLEQKQKKKSKHDTSFYEPLETKLLDFIGKNPSMKEVKHLACKASKCKFNVIITGDSGTGKSRLAREIHNMGNKDAPFIEVNCNAIAPSLFESELFGYVPGAFTGAAGSGKKGFFEEANGGTIFLDEIGDLPLDIQVKLLHVLQNKRIYPVGSSKAVDVDVRVISATNRNLEEDVKNGRFRQDLYYRINVFPIHIPPLKQRIDDLYFLINSVLSEISQRYNIENKLLSEEAFEKMLRYDWPGNVRELENVMERAVILCDSPVIYSEYILIEEKECKLKTLKAQMEDAEARIIKESLIQNRYNKHATMEELKISKTVFYEKLRKYKLME